MATTETGLDQIKNVTDHLRDTFADRVIRPTKVSEEIVQAFHAVDRGEFAPDNYKGIAYQDEIVPLDRMATISQPSLVAYMIAFVGVRENSRVLEVGTATGYQASVLSHIAKFVHTIEVNPRLAAEAENNITRLGYSDRITVHCGDGAEGVSGEFFDAIIITASVKSIPSALLEQLEPGGKIIAPVAEEVEGEAQLTMIKKELDGTLNKTVISKCAFVPLRSELDGGWNEQDIHRAELKQFKHWLIKALSKQGISYQDMLYQTRMNVLDANGYNADLPSEDELLSILMEDYKNPTEDSE